MRLTVVLDQTAPSRAQGGAGDPGGGILNSGMLSVTNSIIGANQAGTVWPRRRRLLPLRRHFIAATAARAAVSQIPDLDVGELEPSAVTNPVAVARATTAMWGAAPAVPRRPAVAFRIPDVDGDKLQPSVVTKTGSGGSPGGGGSAVGPGATVAVAAAFRIPAR